MALLLIYSLFWGAVQYGGGTDLADWHMIRESVRHTLWILPALRPELLEDELPNAYMFSLPSTKREWTYRIRGRR
jgi:hypothetical protein